MRNVALRIEQDRARRQARLAPGDVPAEDLTIAEESLSRVFRPRLGQIRHA